MTTVVSVLLGKVKENKWNNVFLQYCAGMTVGDDGTVPIAGMKETKNEVIDLLRLAILGKALWEWNAYNRYAIFFF